MDPTARPLVMFVAMPYTDMGKDASWKVPAVESFYRDAGVQLAKELDQPVKVEIEKYRRESGIVHESMFRAIYEADIFIADLSGANANVFLELGIRYGVTRGVTILTSQESGAPYDLAPMRVIRYADRREADSLKALVETIVNDWKMGRERETPILKMLQLEVVKKDRWDRVAGVRVEALLKAATATDDPKTKLRLVRQAVEDDPFSLTARLHLAKLLRQRKDYSSALDATAEALTIFPASSELHKERGLTLDRIAATGENRLDDAILEFQKAVQLDANDADLHCCLGGALRRRALQNKNTNRPEFLAKSKDHYREAVALNRHDTYAGLNLLRLMILMEDMSDSYLDRMFHLCAFEVADSQTKSAPEGYWKLFDKADTEVFRAHRDEALDIYNQATDSVPLASRSGVLLSPKRTWEELVRENVLSADVKKCAEDVLALLDAKTPKS